jgi:serine protease AprX
MDGKTAISSRGAKIAATKGIIVVSSAGNEGNNSWKYITAPGDADSILTIGAISTTKQIASFSSRGPTFDRRIKPDVVAIGQGTAIQSSAENFIRSNGTSFSAPVITGLTACLWQAFPDKTNFEIIDAIKKSSSQYQTPDTIVGYGIPDFYKALQILRNKLAIASLQPDFNNLIISPNPFESSCYIQFGPVPKTKSCIYITDIQGKILYKTDVNTNTYTRNSIECGDMGKYTKGIYFIHLISGNKHLKAKVVKQ